ncbi:putative CDK-activating kinase assembly factor MAT1 [Quillaja saponaria]|uniref:CDK-activating kinase assembly factor MAT1 n=1 Tax=Quillaja saponaria TaxID=32244 RepID=A0AAD7QDL6_QUISA|nr:putative CDK-activating kinase assembly factor MAT1 [Quillaja saponaria]
MINLAWKAEELAAALEASKRHPTQTDNDASVIQNSQAGFGAFAPTFPGGQPRPTGMVPQPVQLGGESCDMHVYPLDNEEMMRLSA